MPASSSEHPPSPRHPADVFQVLGAHMERSDDSAAPGAVVCGLTRPPRWDHRRQTSLVWITARSDLHDALALLGQPIAYHRPGLWLTLLPRSHGVGRHDQMRSLVPSHGFNESAEISQVLDSCNWVSSSSVVLRGCRSPSLLRSPSSTPDATRGSRADARRPSRSAHPRPRTQCPCG